MTICRAPWLAICGAALGLGMGITSINGAAAPLTLLGAYQAALQNDPTYRGAIYENQAGQENKNIGRSYLLPKVALTYATNVNQTEIVTTQLYQGQNYSTATNPSYVGMNAALTLRQPIINFEALSLYKQSLAKANYSTAQFAARGQDLVLRVVGAYADAQYTEDQLKLAVAQRDAYQEQQVVNDRLLKSGEGTVTDQLETQARSSLAEAQVIEAQDNLATARNTLGGIVGLPVTELAPLNKNFKLLPIQPTTFDEWQNMAMRENAEIVALNASVEVARQEINRQRSGHAPAMDFVASYGRQKSASTNTYNQDTKVGTIGIELTIPLFSGGYVSASTRQAVANYEKVRSDLDVKISQLSIELHKQYGLILSSSPRINALIKSTESARLLITATRESIKGGTRINLDLLNAEQQLYTSERDLALARYNYLLAYLRLRNAAGTLATQDLMDVSASFMPAG
ncbi:TolC family outer membrane protein [Glaciimonas sp. PAMC28666]|uniref:TolC family outer membrane protein n=1 Tax=Glaciimonas sp. PAMC28666 TaxID=2807626 RepID=UPI001966866E|nr:TolC family outer membrane protein [Glaciimonas sp. PAMC28666]QRX84536.1 TolC family outer membrane protein [Glaciimonas sp. PAMC28666]